MLLTRVQCVLDERDRRGQVVNMFEKKILTGLRKSVDRRMTWCGQARDSTVMKW